MQPDGRNEGDRTMKYFAIQQLLLLSGLSIGIDPSDEIGWGFIIGLVLCLIAAGLHDRWFQAKETAQ